MLEILLLLAIVVVALRFGYWRGHRDFFTELSSSVRMGDYHRLRASDIKEELAEKTSRAVLLQEQNEKLYQACSEYEQQVGEQEGKIKKLVNQKKSSEVKLGLVAENSLGFMADLPYNFNDMRHLANPIDYIYFNLSGPDPEIVFVEVKSAGAKESKKQRDIRKLIAAGKVRYELVRIGPDGVDIERH